jgi:hypothetical protein
MYLGAPRHMACASCRIFEDARLILADIIDFFHAGEAPSEAAIDLQSLSGSPKRASRISY